SVAECNPARPTRFYAEEVALKEGVMAAPKEDRQETLRWAVLATHLNGAVDSGRYDHIDPGVVLRHVVAGDLLEYLRRELGKDVSYALDKMTDVQRHRLLQHCRWMASAYEITQFHVRRN